MTSSGLRAPRPTAAGEAWERRRLGPLAASAIVVANMIGAGLFTTSGFALADLGDPRAVVAAWLVGGVVALCGALSYGGIAHRIPESGGEATYLGAAVHPAVGFLAGWVSVFAGFAGPIAASALAFEVYLETALGVRLPHGVVGGALIAAVAALHALRPHLGTASLTGMVLLKLALLVTLVTWGASYPPGSAQITPSGFRAGAFAVTLVWISFSYSGWNGAVYLAGEIRDPGRNLARVLWMPTLGVAVLYAVTNAVFLRTGDAAVLAGRADFLAAAAGGLGGEWVERGVAALVALALLTSVSVMVLSGPRVLVRLARDGIVPRALARGRVAPAAAIACQAAVAIAILAAAGLAELIAALGYALGLSASAVVGVAMWLRRREGPDRVPIPGHPWVPLVFVVVTVATSAFLVVRNPAEAALGTAFLLSGLPAYAIFRGVRRSGAGL